MLGKVSLRRIRPVFSSDAAQARECAHTRSGSRWTRSWKLFLHDQTNDGRIVNCSLAVDPALMKRAALRGFMHSTTHERTLVWSSCNGLLDVANKKSRPQSQTGELLYFPFMQRHDTSVVQGSQTLVTFSPNILINTSLKSVTSTMRVGRGLPVPSTNKLAFFGNARKGPPIPPVEL